MDSVVFLAGSSDLIGVKGLYIFVNIYVSNELFICMGSQDESDMVEANSEAAGTFPSEILALLAGPPY